MKARASPLKDFQKTSRDTRKLKSFQKTVENGKIFRDALWNFAGLYGKFNSCKLRGLVLDENSTCNIYSSTVKLKQLQAAATDDHKRLE
jgi:hypothetical protein